MKDSPEGEHLYREIKEMEMEALSNPDPEDAPVELAMAEDMAELPIADDEPERVIRVEAEGSEDDPPGRKVVAAASNGRRGRHPAHGEDEDEDDEEGGDFLSDLDRLASMDPTFVNDPVRMYLREISHATLLKSDQEMELAHQIAKGDVEAT